MLEGGLDPSFSPQILVLTLPLGRPRYYARALLTCLHRSIAIPEWAKLRRGEPVSLERALGAFDLFIPESGYGDLDEVSSPSSITSIT